MPLLIEQNLQATAAEFNIPFETGECFRTASQAIMFAGLPAGSLYCEGVVCPLDNQRYVYLHETNSLIEMVIAHAFILLPDGRILDPIMAENGINQATYVYKTFTTDEVVRHMVHQKQQMKPQWQMTKSFGKAWTKMFGWLDTFWGICTREWDLEMMAAFACVSEEVCHRSISVRSIREAQPVRKAYYKFAKKTYTDMLNGKPVDIATPN
jgi:hypothetical protein